MGTKGTGPLTRERILEVAMRLVDEGGLGAFNMRTLGSKLGVKGMALYYHFQSKTDIIDSLVGRLMGQVDLCVDEEDWCARLRGIHQSLRRSLLEHANLLPAAILRPFNTPQAARVTETVLDVLLSAGFDEQNALHAYQSLRAYVLGYTLTETVGLLSDPPCWDNPERMRLEDYGQHGFRRILQVIPAVATFDHVEEFSAGLDALLSGLEERLRQLRRGSTAAAMVGGQTLQVERISSSASRGP